MKSLLLLLLGAVVVATVSHARKSRSPTPQTELLALAEFGKILDELGRDMEALLTHHEKTLKSDENLDPKFFHTRVEKSTTYLH